MAATEPVYISYLNYIGSGAPADGDQITRDNSQYPLNTVYTDRETGITYVRKATTKVAATDWQAGSASGDPTIINALPLVYSCLLFQTGTTVPDVTVLTNTIGNIVWTRLAAGQYQGTLAGAFTEMKTYCAITNNVGSTIFLLLDWLDDSTIMLNTYSNTVASDGVLSNTALEIKVYP